MHRNTFTGWPSDGTTGAVRQNPLSLNPTRS
jgi:hypothetical protein